MSFLTLLTDVLVGTVGLIIDPGGGPAGLAVITIAAAALLFVLITTQRALPLPAYGTFVASAVRQQANRTAFLPLCDPDAPGRPRPRAPSAQPRVA